MTLVAHDRLQAFRQRIEAALPRLACFDAADYLAMHADLAGIDLLRHFSEHGLWEQRPSINPEHLTANLSRATALAMPPCLSTNAMERAYRGAARTRAAVHIPVGASGQERLIARGLTAALDASGLDVPIRQGLPKPGAPDAIVVGPERLFAAGGGDVHLDRLGAALVVISAAPGQPAFAAQLPYLLGAAGVLAIESETYVLCLKAGIPAVWLGALSGALPGVRQPTSHPLFLGLSRPVRAAPAGLNWSDRPIDVLAVEAASPARAAAWTRMSEGMTRFTGVVYQPPDDEADNEEEALLRRYLYARSKIVLHLHSETQGSLSSALVEEAAAAGAVIISEPASPHLLLKPDRHYFESSARRMPTLIDGLIGGKDGAERATAAVAAAQRTLAAAFDPEALGLAVINLLSDTRGVTYD